MPSEAERCDGEPATLPLSRVELGVATLAADGLVAFPTETVWGLGARAVSKVAVERLRAWKGRESDKPLSVLVAGAESLDALGAEVSDEAAALVRRFWPGALTLVVRAGCALAPGVLGPDGGLGLRCSSHPVASALARAAEARGLGPVTATSLNRAGAAPAQTHEEALAMARSAGVPLFVLEGVCSGLPPSTVVDATGPALRILREGAIPADAIAAVHTTESQIS